MQPTTTAHRIERQFKYNAYKAHTEYWLCNIKLLLLLFLLMLLLLSSKRLNRLTSKCSLCPTAIVRRFSQLLLFLIMHMNWGVDHRTRRFIKIEQGTELGLMFSSFVVYLFFLYMYIFVFSFRRHNHFLLHFSWIQCVCVCAMHVYALWV